MEFWPVEDVQEDSGKPLRNRCGVAAEDRGQYFGWVEGKADGGDEQALFRSEEVGNQLGVDPCVGGDRPQRRAVVAARRELAGGRGEDRLAGAVGPGPAAAAGSPARVSWWEEVVRQPIASASSCSMCR